MTKLVSLAKLKRDAQEMQTQANIAFKAVREREENLKAMQCRYRVGDVVRLDIATFSGVSSIFARIERISLNNMRGRRGDDRFHITGYMTINGEKCWAVPVTIDRRWGLSAIVERDGKPFVAPKRPVFTFTSLPKLIPEEI